MKIEIEYEEVERLKEKIEELQKENCILEEKLNSLNEKELKKNAIELSKKLFDLYISSIFKKLGFNEDKNRYNYECIHFESDLEHWLGEEWYKSDKLKVTISAKISNEFRKAFLNLGIITKD